MSFPEQIYNHISKEQARSRYERATPYPTGYSWKEFVASFKVGHYPFALVLERQLEWNEIYLAPDRPIFFGAVTPSQKGHINLGFGCFSRKAKLFGDGNESKNGHEIFIPGQLNPSILRTSAVEQGVVPSFHSPMDHKVMEVITDPDRLDEELLRFVSWFIPRKEDVISVEDGARLVKVSKHLGWFLYTLLSPRSEELFPKTRKGLITLREKLEQRRKWLCEENERLQKEIDDNHKEWKTLLHYS